MIASPRRRRVVYRLYGEDEFLRGAGAGPSECVQTDLTEGGDVEVHDRTLGPGAAAQRLRRLVGIAVLLGAVGFVGGAIMRSGSRSSRAVADLGADTPAAHARVTATPRAAGARPSTADSGTAARRGSNGHAPRVARAPRPLAQTGPAGGRRRRYWERDERVDQPGAVDQRPGDQHPGANGDPEGARPVIAPSEDTEPAAVEAAAAKPAAAESHPVGSPIGGSPIEGSRPASSANAAVPIATGTASSPPQTEFGFER